MSGPGPGIDLLRQRLAGASDATRRLAVHDLIELARRDPTTASGVQHAMLDRLPLERDAKCAIRMIRFLAASGAAEARPTLLALYNDASTPAEIAVEAVRAHDSLAARAGR